MHATGTELYLGLTNNLKQTCPSMHRVYLTMKDLPPDEITPEMVSLASGRIALDPAALVEWLGKNEAQATAMSISSAFKKQIEAAAGPWDQVKFEDMLAKWLVATDQPFSTVDDPEFRDFLTYAHHPAPNLKIPHRDAIKRRVMRMYEDTIRATRQMFQASSSYAFIFKLTTALQHEVEGKVSISLDAWTSSNNYAFMAIVAHYITKAGELQELLIDFREMDGAHSGANMAEATWDTLLRFGLENRVSYIDIPYLLR